MQGHGSRLHRNRLGLSSNVTNAKGQPIEGPIKFDTKALSVSQAGGPRGVDYYSQFCSQPVGLNSTQWTRWEYMDSKNSELMNRPGFSGDSGGWNHATPTTAI
jgi:hypothetical protein